MEACYGGTDVMERSCAVARGIDINRGFRAKMGVKWPYFAKMTPQKKSCLRSPMKRPTNTPNTRNGRVISKIKTVIAGAGSK
jgi:hypothetical protein